MDSTSSLAGYRVLRVAGAGGMGTVYEAERVADGCRVAVKVLHAHLVDDAVARARFAREADALRAIRHRRIVVLVEELAAPPALVLAWVDGEPLDATVRRDGPLAPERAAWITGEIASALACVHAAGLVHRDLKPANVLVDADGPVLADFGIAGLAVAPPDLTPAGITMATPSYASPELLRGDRHDARADLWALAVLYYELVAGAPPFAGATLAELCARIADATPPPLRVFRPDAPDRLDALFARLLHRDPEQRPATADDLRAHLTRAVLTTDGGAPLPNRERGK